MTANPLQLAGLEFVEFADRDDCQMDNVFADLGFSKLSRFKHKDIFHYRQNSINFLLNADKSGFSAKFSLAHGPSVSSIGLRVEDANFALQEAVRRGAIPATLSDKDLPYPAVFGVGESLIYFVDRHGPRGSIYEQDFVEIADRRIVEHKGFLAIDHLTNNVNKGTMKEWAAFYKHVFGFVEIRYFDIRGVRTGLSSYALRSPDGSFSIPINEGDESESQIETYLRDYNGPGVQHIALRTEDLLFSLDSLIETGIETLDIGKSYYRRIFERISGLPAELRRRIMLHQILVDGDNEGTLFQVFTKNLFGPIFLEFIQRDGCSGFGEGNFQALFESIERTQEFDTA